MEMEIEFHEIALQDRDWITACLAEDDKNGCEYTFANNFMWRKVYRVEAAKMHGCLVIRFMEYGGNDVYYSYPIGAGDKKTVIEELICLSKQEQQEFYLSTLLERDREQLLSWFPGRLLITPNRKRYDYIYLREKLAKLPGKKLHKKRNHIARFTEGDDWSYEPMCAENIEGCWQMACRWKDMRSEKWNESMEEEFAVLREAIDHFDALCLQGGVLLKAGEIVAFCIGEPLNSDTFVVHFEKAYADVQGAYPAINQQFAQHIDETYLYVNREEDTGDLGLRKAKMSYYPELLLKKYVAKESRVVYADRKKDGEAIVNLWKACFGEDEADILFYLDHRMEEDNMLAIFEDGKLVSMASFLQTEYCMDGEYVPARYVYAVATLPEYQGRGFASEILRFAGELYAEPLILVPAEESLYTYYEKQGFVEAFPKKMRLLASQHSEARPWGKTDLTAQEVREENSIFCAEVTPQQYAKIRDERFHGEGYVRWSEKAIEYALAFYARYGGHACVVVQQDEAVQEEILLYAQKNDVLVILETSLLGAALQQAVSVLMEETGAARVVYKRMGGMLRMPEGKRSAALPPNGYLNLTLG